jgi:hypothetical protein
MHRVADTDHLKQLLKMARVLLNVNRVLVHQRVDALEKFKGITWLLTEILFLSLSVGMSFVSKYCCSVKQAYHQHATRSNTPHCPKDWDRHRNVCS